MRGRKGPRSTRSGALLRLQCGTGGMQEGNLPSFWIWECQYLVWHRAELSGANSPPGSMTVWGDWFTLHPSLAGLLELAA